MLKKPDGKHLGQSLYMTCRCGQFQRAQEIIISLDEIDPVEKDIALEWADKKGNTHLHVTVGAPTDEESIEAKLGLCVKLFEEGFILSDTNLEGKTCLDLAPENIAGKLPDLEMKVQTSRRARGNSLIAEGATLKSVASGAFVAVAAGRFRLRRHSQEEDYTAQPTPEADVMEV
mmetsp:Transcript_59593/g.122165  ORF Transcript_59593/g.122165 Transcript_59593/m.122165 type:complete len:174 (+) Transcript_59593:181-702(+)|eukprot:CAMPEP_0181312622 /NCGR_PEP_ID=MMETSP1101-20121128/13798_1 /TAXON_ID=46948 /ORGANISM="Rhodomonas abbreviata, Strain Caron Lab Isolate" /LENGTH=173 /DNA_ID=CAMNT_0023419491 /DNA_START=177 /DNA_END=698 /DNA_ORIENTATION=-